VNVIRLTLSSGHPFLRGLNGVALTRQIEGSADSVDSRPRLAEEPPDSGPTRGERAVPKTDRRAAIRYTPVLETVCVGWWEGNHFRTHSGCLVNLSTSGALLRVAEPIPVGRRLWLCVMGMDVSQWVRCQLLEETLMEDGNRLARLIIPEAFPYEVFKTAVWGKVAVAQRVGATLAGQGSPPSQRGFPESRAVAFGAVPVARGSGDTTPGSHPLARREPIRTSQTGPCGMVESSSPHPPALAASQRRQQQDQDRLSPLSWVTIFVICLVVIILLTIVASQRLGALRQLPLWSMISAVHDFGGPDGS